MTPTFAPTIDGVHAWLVALDGLRHLDGASLSPNERARAMRLAAGDVRRRFVVARAALRDILAAYAGAAPAGLRFCYGPFGKPALAPPLDWLRFNVAHSHDLALVAVAHWMVGVDVERVRPLADGPLALAARTFAPHEAAALRAAPASRQLDEFFRYWTCKEAYVKARGAGLSLPFDQFAVAFSPHAAPRLLVAPDGDRGRLRPAPDWSLLSFRPAPGYWACLAVNGAQVHVRWYRYPQDLPLIARDTSPAVRLTD